MKYFACCTQQALKCSCLQFPVLLRLGVLYGEEKTALEARNAQLACPAGDLHPGQFDDCPGDGALADQVLEGFTWSKGDRCFWRTGEKNNE